MPRGSAVSCVGRGSERREQAQAHPSRCRSHVQRRQGRPPPVRAVVERHADEVYVIAPIFTARLAWVTNDDSDAIADAEQRLAATLQQLYDRDVEADGTIGDDDAILTAIGDALAEFPADEIILAVHAGHDRHWRERNLAAKIRSSHSQPLIELVTEADGTASIRS
jgi:hypothetical protein